APRFNYKLTDLQAALGRSQLARFDAFLARRRAIAARYRARLAGLPCRVPADAGGRHVYHRFVIEIERPVDGVIAALERRGVAARRPVFRPIHRALGLGDYPEAERLWTRTLSLPCYPTLSDDDVDAVATALAAALLGGAGVYLAFAVTVLANFHFSMTLKGVALGASVVVAFGILDDVIELPAWAKLVGQLGGAALAMLYGVVLSVVPSWWP